jgi:hypothetical protein
MPDSGHVSADVISKLHEVDPVFRDVVGLLYGDAVDTREVFDLAKMGDTSEVHVAGDAKRKDHRQRKVTAALSATGAAAGTAGLAYGANDMVRAVKTGTKIRRSTKALVPLEVAGLAGEVMSTKILHGDTKKKALAKALDDIVVARREHRISTEQAIELSEALVAKASKRYLEAELAATKGALKSAPKATRMMLGTTATVAGATGYHVGKKRALKRTGLAPLVPSGVDAPKGKHTASATVEKADGLVDYGFVGEISKLNEDKRLAFGWCSVSEIDGLPVKDLQGDYAPIDEIEKSAYAYVVTSRVGGDMHARDGASPVHTSDLVESFVATPEKLEQMGLSKSAAAAVPVGWWVGFKVNDDEQWQMVKDGRRAGFSVHGRGSRVQKALEATA